MSIIEHGDWTRYIPNPPPEHAPIHAMFAQREDDAQDWYQYVTPSAANFQPDSAKMTVYRQGINGPTVGAAVFDPTALWPAEALVVEDTGYAGNDPQTDYGGKIYDPATGTFSDPPPPLDVLAEMRSLLDRMSALEAKLGVR